MNSAVNLIGVAQEVEQELANLASNCPLRRSASRRFRCRSSMIEARLMVISDHESAFMRKIRKTKVGGLRALSGAG
jgi:hypothetical protein